MQLLCCHRLDCKKHFRDLPGLVDLLISGIWSIFFLSMGSSIAAWGSCKASSLCLAWKGTVGLGFLLFVLYAITAVLAALDLRDQLSALKEAAAPPAPAQGAARGLI